MGVFDRARRWLLGESRASAISGMHPGDPGLSAFLGWTPSLAGVNVTAETAMQCPPFAACVRLLSDTIATVPLDFFKRVSDGERERANDDQRHQVTQWPNDWQTGSELRRFLAQSTMLSGNGYAHIPFSGGGLPQQLVPLEFSRTTPFRDAQKRVWYRHWPEEGPPVTYSSAEILHVRGPWVKGDGLLGASPVEMFREPIGLCMAQLEYLSRFFRNSAAPKGGLEVPATLGEKAVDTLREDWHRQHQGLENAHKIAVLWGGAKWKDIGIDNQKSQALELYKQSVSTLASLMGIPPHMIGETDKQSSWGTGVEQQAIGFITFVVRPWYVGIEQSMNKSLLTVETRKRFYYEHNADALLRGDFKTRMDGFALMIQWGLASPNEVRRLMNMPAVDGGDDRLQPLNMVPVSLVKDVLVGDADKADRAMKVLRTLQLGRNEYREAA